jgi:hypothetical protein
MFDYGVLRVCMHYLFYTDLLGIINVGKTSCVCCYAGIKCCLKQFLLQVIIIPYVLKNNCIQPSIRCLIISIKKELYVYMFYIVMHINARSWHLIFCEFLFPQPLLMFSLFSACISPSLQRD